MVSTAAHYFLLDMREALAIWLALTAFAVIMLIPVTAPARRDSAGRAQTRAARARLRRAHLAEQAQDLHRYAEEVAVAAGRAAVTAQRKRAEWAAVHRTEEPAWRSYDVADQAARRAAEVLAFGVPETPLTNEELEARKRHLHRAATEAHRRHELSTEELVGVLFQTDGWDPREHPFVQEAKLRRMGRDRLLRVCQEASAVERAAWQAAELAAAARRSLEDEAYAAAQRARQARHWLTTDPERRMRTRLAAWPSPATR